MLLFFTDNKPSYLSWPGYREAEGGKHWLDDVQAGKS
jgi:hypothetical protein